MPFCEPGNVKSATNELDGDINLKRVSRWICFLFLSQIRNAFLTYWKNSSSGVVIEPFELKTLELPVIWTWNIEPRDV